MSLYPSELPWLSKPAALEAVWQVVSTTATRELGLAGYLDTADGEGWFAPRSAFLFDAVATRQAEAGWNGGAEGVETAFERLAQSRRSLPAGTFVFVCSDFLSPPPPEVWLRALGFRWDLVPVIVQDPIWEQSFPPADGLVVPFAEAGGRREAAAAEAQGVARAARGERGADRAAAHRLPQPRARPDRDRRVVARRGAQAVLRLGGRAAREPPW